jgi:hypothetical protein
MKKLSTVLLPCLAAIAVILSGCAGKSDQPVAGVDGKPSAADVHKPRHRAADHQVVVMLGPDYASRPEILDGLISEFGLSGSGGMVVKFLYPEDFKEGKQVHLSKLTAAAKIPEATVLVTVGAPEGTIYELNRIRAARPDIKIVSLFANDDAIPVEAVSDIMVENATSGELLASENTDFTPPDGIDVLLLASVLAAEDKDSSVEPLAGLTTSMDTARNFLKRKGACNDWNFSDYVDPDTNLRSRTRLVLATAAAGSGS